MSFSARTRRVTHPWWSGTRRLSGRLGLTARSVAALAFGLVVLGVTVLLFGGISEDVTQHNGLATEDGSHLHFFIQHRTARLVGDARWVTQLGGVGFLAILAVVVAAVLWLREARLIVALAPGLALGAAGASAAIAKQVVGRARPPVNLHRVTENGASFPSGHATDSTAFYLTAALVIAVVVLRRPLARGATVAAGGLLAAAVGASRLMLGVHWPTDVLAGWALGTSAAVAVTMLAVVLNRVVPVDGPPPQGRRARISHRIAHVLLLMRPPKAVFASRL